MFWADPQTLHDPPVAVGAARVVRTVSADVRAADGRCHQPQAARAREPGKRGDPPALLQDRARRVRRGRSLHRRQGARHPHGLPRVPRRVARRRSRSSCDRQSTRSALLALLMLVDAFKARRRAGAAPHLRALPGEHGVHQQLGSRRLFRGADRRRLAAAAAARAPLTRLARSKSLWERRIAIIATFDGIRRGEFDETFRIADLLLHDDHDLIHKAVGWLLREVGKRDGAARARVPREPLQDACRGRCCGMRSRGFRRPSGGST